MAIRMVLQLLLLLLACGSSSTATTPLAPGASSLSAAIRRFPAANCPDRCGDLEIAFPFGIGPGCFRHPGFAVICDDNATSPPRLLLMDGVTEVVEYGIAGSNQSLRVDISHAMSMSPGADGSYYNATWNTPGSNFILVLRQLDISTSSCDFRTYLTGNPNVNPLIPLCTRCDGQQRSDSLSGHKKCNNLDTDMLVNTLELKFVRKEQQQQRQTVKNNVSVLAGMTWIINDQPSCDAAAAAASSDKKASFACVSNHSSCKESTSTPGYSCSCDDGYTGDMKNDNPYVLNGCSSVYCGDYNPSAGRNAKCSRSCGKTKVPFPFGLEDGCFARADFKLSCDQEEGASSADSKLMLMSISEVLTYINISEGLFGVEESSPDRASRSGTFKFEYTYSGIVQWAVTQLTCQEASQNVSTYACVSPNNKCLHVDDMGYRCACKDGYAGNPYVTGPDGCHDINECEDPGKCQGICHNTDGSYSCAECPGEYDPTKMMCTPSRRQIILTGVAVGLGVGFGLLFLGLAAVLLIRRWRRDIQKQLRRKYFAKNHGLLLEQLISSNEDASERTKIFSLEELKRATNSFDHTRILGRGAHGMVYKGILSDQRVVAIKKSKVIEQGEIDQFINEVAILWQVNHRNIVKLYGCCLETEVPLLVYDFVPNGSLYEILHSGSSSSLSLSWDDCLRISAEAAGALYYLHSAASISVFHRDVKSSNILLDANYTAKVSDFGASRLVGIDQTHVTTHVQGTFGYLDPEYFHTWQLNEKSDVYSFGVVLLELLLRKKPILTSESGSVAQSLYSYFLGEMNERPIKEIVAAQTQEEATEEEISNVASLAEKCLQLRGEQRPTMKEVEMSLQLLRANRLKSFHVTPENGRATQSSLHGRAGAGVQSHSGNNTVDPISADSQRCYSLEQEFLSSASLPR